jgi:peptidoglycan/xylan/chitin deacetylase (PgdA/CDA1 family)
VDIAVEAFRRQMTKLRDDCHVVTLKEALFDSASSGRGRPVVALTFDDAFLNFRRVAWPILAELGLPAVLYVPVGFVNGDSGCPIRGAGIPACSWEDLKALAKEGTTIGSHTVSHVNLARASTEVVERELRDSRQELEQRLAVAVESFCYPQAKYTRSVLRLASDHYESAVTAGGRRFVRGRDDRLAVPRFPIRRDIRSFHALIHAPIWVSEAVAHVVRQYVP